MNEFDSNARERFLVEPEWLQNHLYDHNFAVDTGYEAVRIVDMRGFVRTETEPGGSQTATYLGADEEYRAGHIPGAVYLDWTRDIVDRDDSIPAQVAPASKIAQVLGDAGIGDNHLIVAYDAHPASQFATRLWWVLQYYGNENVRVLNGGWKRWIAEGRPSTTTVPDCPPATFTPSTRPGLRVEAGEILSKLSNPRFRLIDARDEGQFTGAVRRGSRGGRIPGALHLPREVLFNSDGTFRDSEGLRDIVRKAGIEKDNNVVAYCNGGVAATSVLFALSMLGFPSLANYDGSWNEWSERADLPIAAGPA